MKKKIIIFIVSVLLILICLLLIFVFKERSYCKTDLPFTQDDGKLMGIMYIGYGSECDYTIVDEYFKTRDFETIELGGEEKYLIIPRYNKIDVYSLILEEDGEVSEIFVKSMNEPFYINCNVSDIFSNSMLRIMNNDKQYSYSPYISLKDGSVVVEDFVLNIEK